MEDFDLVVAVLEGALGVVCESKMSAESKTSCKKGEVHGSD